MALVDRHRCPRRADSATRMADPPWKLGSPACFNSASSAAAMMTKLDRQPRQVRFAASPRTATTASSSTARSFSVCAARPRRRSRRRSASPRRSTCTIQVSLAAPCPDFLYDQARENKWLHDEDQELLTGLGTQIAPLSYPHLSHTEIFDWVEAFYKRFYFGAPKIAAIFGEMVRSPEMMKRRLREGVEFFRFLRERRDVAA
jgi:hypothetical protein